MDNYETVYTGECKTYAAIFYTAWHLLDLAEQNVHRRLLNLQAATVFFAFAFEAYLNHLGERELKLWGEDDRISSVRKLQLLSKHLGFSDAAPPFQRLPALFKFRNNLAHGRTQVIDAKKPGEPQSHDEAFRLLPWEQLTVAAVRSHHDDVRDAIEAINKAKPHPDPMLWNEGARQFHVHPVKQV